MKKNKRHGPKTIRSRTDACTFHDILAETRVAAARAAWTRAVWASRLRHLARGRAVAVLARVKLQAVTRAFQIAPELVRITLDNEHHVGLVSVVWNQSARLHLPADVQI